MKKRTAIIAAMLAAGTVALCASGCGAAVLVNDQEIDAEEYMQNQLEKSEKELEALQNDHFLDDLNNH